MPQTSDLCAGADGAGHDHDDVSSNNCSSSGGSGSANNDDKSGLSDDETSSVNNDDEEESVKKFVPVEYEEHGLELQNVFLFCRHLQRIATTK